MHLLFCAHLLNIFLFFRIVDLRYFSHTKHLGGVWFVQFSFLHIQTVYVMIVRTLNMCTLYFVHLIIFWIVELRHYYIYTFEVLTLCNLCVICNSNRFHSFILKLCIMIVYTLKMCTGDAGPEQSLVLFYHEILLGNQRKIFV